MSVIRVWYPSWMKIWRSVYFMVDTCKQRFCMKTHKGVHHRGSLNEVVVPVVCNVYTCTAKQRDKRRQHLTLFANRKHSWTVEASTHYRYSSQLKARSQNAAWSILCSLPGPGPGPKLTHPVCRMRMLLNLWDGQVDPEPVCVALGC